MKTRYLFAVASALLLILSTTADAQSFGSGRSLAPMGAACRGGKPATYYGRDSLRGSFYRGSGFETTPGHYAYPVRGVYRPSYGYPYIGTSFYRLGIPDGYYASQRGALSVGVGY